MTKPANWTFRLPRASLRDVAEATRPIRAVLDPGAVAPDPGVDTGPHRRRASLAEFASRAADEAEDRQAEAVEVRLDRSASPRFLPEDRYEMLTVAPAAPWYPFPPTRPGQIVADLPVEDGCYGVVLCVGALERHPEPLPLTIELTRILAPGGRLFLVAPLIVPEPPRGGPMVTTDRRRYGLNYLLDAASLRIEYLEPVERSSAYAVIACKSPSASPRDRRATDNT